MANNYKHLGQLGLEQLLQLMAAEFDKKVVKVDGKGLSTNDFTNALLEKLNGIAEGANKYEHATHTEQALGLYKVQVDGEGHVIAVTAVAKEDITNLGIPGQDTTYVVATQSESGLMSSTDKKKLDGIEEGANKYVHATHGAYAAGIYKITVDSEGHVTAASAVTKAELAAIIGEATQSESGLMSAADKKAVDELGAIAKLNEIGEDNLSEALKEKINTASAGNHSHANKELLDTYDQTNADLKDAVAKKHEHANAEELAKIAAGDKAKWDAAQANAEATAAAELKKVVNGTIAQNTAAAAAAQSTADEAKAAAQANATAITSGDATTLQSAKDYADSQINSKIASAYKAAGSATYETLPEADAAHEGYVYNMTADFTTDEDFVEGAGKQYKAGTNVVIVEESEGVFKYDILAMSFDGFVQEANVSEYTADEVTTMWNSVFTA